MNTQTLQGLLASSSLVQHFYCYDELDSTMDHARRLVNKTWNNEDQHGTLVLADAQTSGRGRHGRAWDVPPGSSILGTIILYRKSLPGWQSERAPTLGAGDAVSPAGASFSAIPGAQLSLLAAALPVAICRGINSVLPSARIKYPNDIVCGDRKLGGVLLETVRDCVLAGFGVNCSQEMTDFPPNLKMPATSIFLETGKLPSRERLVQRIVAELEDVLSPMQFPTAGDSMRELCVTLGREILIDLGEEGVVQGIAETITADGILKLKTPSGVRSIHTTQVQRTWSPEAEEQS